MLIRRLEERDWPAVKAIFEDGIAGGKATFDREAPSWEEWDGAHLPLRLVAEDAGQIVGWAALSPYSHRSATAASASRASTWPRRRAGAGSAGR